VRRPRVSIIIPARDEALAIEGAVRSHLSQDYPDFEVIVVDDRSTDETPAILARLAAENSRLRVIGGVEPPTGWLGKPHAQHQGSAVATGEILLFADADVTYDSMALAEGVETLERRELDLLGFFPRLEMVGFWENVLMPCLPVSYFFGPAFLFNSDWQRRFAAAGGAGMLMRTEAYRAAGRHEAIRSSVIDDIHLAIRVRRAGGRCRMVMADHRVHIRMYRGFREVVDGFTKNLAFTFAGGGAIPLALSTVFSFAAWTIPALVLVAAACGLDVPARDVRLAAGAVGITVVARIALSRFLKYPLWAALTQPLMAAVWLAIAVRSFTWRFLRRELVWRGRRYDAAKAGF